MAIMWKLPRNIRLNDNIVVREDEIAVFYRDGKALAYIDRPDRYSLTSLDIPVVAKIVKFLTGIRQDAEVYYLQKRPFDAKFGSKQPYVFRDKDFGMVNLRTFGQARWRVSEPSNFINRFVGTEGFVTSTQIEGRIRDQIVTTVFDALGELKDKGVSVLDIPANLMEIEQIVLEKAKPHFSPYGVEVQKIPSIYITMPEEVQKAVDAKTAMNVTGSGYMQYQSAQAMREVAVNPGGSGGTAGAGMGVGAGIGMGMQMTGAMMNPNQQAQQTGVATKPCVKCGEPIPVGNNFCGKCGTKQDEAVKCKKCGENVPPGQKFCGECGTPVE